MTINTEDMLNSILESLARIDYVKPSQIPDIDLYMDQVTTFMDTQLKTSKRYEEDKILTKTMINNYAKNNLLPPPDKKKYSKEHVLLLIFIYYFKNLLSIKDIETLLTPLTKKYFEGSAGLDMTKVYEEVFSLEKERLSALTEDIVASYQSAGKTFENQESPDREFLQLFSFICTLSFDVYIKKQLIEKIIDTFPKPETPKKKK
ncbi:MAG: DUF1836 domain-containing protein [Lachnospiraceae bacterium]|nr:DUF1836 domain-containing protein [Lachnospiraceae bacterium]